MINLRQLCLGLIASVALSGAVYAAHHEEKTIEKAGDPGEAGVENSGFSIDSTIREIMAHDKAREVLISYWPQAQNSQLVQFAGGQTVRAIAGYGRRSGLDEETLEDLNHGLATLTVKPKVEVFDSGFSADSTIGEILADQKAREVLVSYWPVAAEPQFRMARKLTLRTVASYPQAELSNEQLEQIDKALASFTLNPDKMSEVADAE